MDTVEELTLLMAISKALSTVVNLLTNWNLSKTTQILKVDTEPAIDTEPEDINYEINKQVAHSYKIDKENLEKLKIQKPHQNL